MSKSAKARVTQPHLADAMFPDNCSGSRETLSNSLMYEMYATGEQNSLDAHLDTIECLLGIARAARMRGDEQSAQDALEELTASYGVSG